MYTTTAHSICSGNYSSAAAQSNKHPPNAPYSSCLVITDEKESQEMDSFCWGSYNDDRIKTMPFPQDRILKVVHVSEYDKDSVKNVWFLPVLDQPLSSNRYYVIDAKGTHKGRAYTCSRTRETRMKNCCFGYVSDDDLNPRQFNHKDVYQQFEICPCFNGGGFFARAVAWDGVPPKFLRRKGWQLYISQSFPTLHLREAQGLHHSLLRPPPLEFKVPLLSSKRSTPRVIGTWYCPYVFVREGTPQVLEKSLLYEVSLKHWWEEIYACRKNMNNGNVVAVDARVKRFLTLINGVEASRDETREAGEFIWFVSGGVDGRRSVGLSSAVVEQLRWLQERRGWFDDGESEEAVRVEGTEEINGGEKGWRRFGCYVLVESFVIRRMDGSLLMNFNCRKTQKIMRTWE